jgi:hypothetical protein
LLFYFVHMIESQKKRGVCGNISGDISTELKVQTK